MSIPAKFMEVAKGKLDAETFSAIYERAVALDRKDMMKPAAAAPVEKAATIERVAAHLNGEPKPIEKAHIQERIERRMEIDVTAADLGDLLRVAMAGGHDVSVVKQTMDLVQECIVNWRGKHFVVVFSKSRGRLITAYAKPKKHKHKVWAGRPRDRLRNWQDDEEIENVA